MAHMGMQTYHTQTVVLLVTTVFLLVLEHRQNSEGQKTRNKVIIGILRNP
jgi:hypothetical protein